MFTFQPLTQLNWDLMCILLCEVPRIHIFSPAALLSYRSGMNFTPEIQSVNIPCLFACVLYCLRTF